MLERSKTCYFIAEIQQDVTKEEIKLQEGHEDQVAMDNQKH